MFPGALSGDRPPGSPRAAALGRGHPGDRIPARTRAKLFLLPLKPSRPGSPWRSASLSREGERPASSHPQGWMRLRKLPRPFFQGTPMVGAGNSRPGKGLSAPRFGGAGVSLASRGRLGCGDWFPEYLGVNCQQGVTAPCWTPSCLRSTPPVGNPGTRRPEQAPLHPSCRNHRRGARAE